MPFDATLICWAFVLVLLAFDVWMSWEARPKPRKLPTLDHVHHGRERSRHEVNGQPMIVGECASCGMRFTLEG